MAEHKPLLSKIRFVLWFLVALVAVGAIYLYMNTTKPQSSYGPVAGAASIADGEGASANGPGIGGPFTMTTAKGKTFTEEHLLGKPHAIFFGFTRCPDVCPTSLQRMAKLRRQMNEADAGSGDEFDIVFVSVDPENDTPDIVGEYLDLFGTPIVGLTGTEDQVAAMTKAYGAYRRKSSVEGSDYTMEHSATILLLDAEGNFAGTIDTQESDSIALEKLSNLVSR